MSVLKEYEANDYSVICILALMRNQSWSSKLQMPAIKLNLNPNLFRRFLYFSDRILKHLTKPIACSLTTRSLEISRLRTLSSFDNGFFFVRFLGRGLQALNHQIMRPKNQKLIIKETTIICRRSSLEKRIPLRTKRLHHVRNDKCFLSIV